MELVDKVSVGLLLEEVVSWGGGRRNEGEGCKFNESRWRCSNELRSHVFIPTQ